MGNYQTRSENVWPSCMPRLREYSLHSSDSRESYTDDEYFLQYSDELEKAVLNNNTDHLRDLVKTNLDLNIPLNEKGDTPLILSIKLTQIDSVKVLLSCSRCKKNHQNISKFSPLDVALITAFDNSSEPRYSACWDIIVELLKAKAEPVCRDAMMYVIRTSLKLDNKAFIYKLIQVGIENSKSFKYHELLLQKLHRHQPVYLVGDFDPFLEAISHFTIKLLKIANKSDLEYLVNAMGYYFESRWNSRDVMYRVYEKFVVYITAAGWKWTCQETAHISLMSRQMASWCSRQNRCVHSLTHLSRSAYRNTVTTHIDSSLEKLPYTVPESVKNYLMLIDIDNLFNKVDNIHKQFFVINFSEFHL